MHNGAGRTLRRPLSEKRQPDAVGAAAAGASLPPGPAPLMVSMPQRSQRFRRKDSHHDQDRPSILSADFAHLGRDIQRISDADYVHVDVMDGLFVPNISIGIPVVKCIRPVTDLPLDVHLMIDRPVRYVEQFCDAGGDLITCHVEADTEENIHSAIVKIHAKGKKAGVVVKPKTPPPPCCPLSMRWN